MQWFPLTHITVTTGVVRAEDGNLNQSGISSPSGRINIHLCSRYDQLLVIASADAGDRE